MPEPSGGSCLFSGDERGVERVLLWGPGSGAVNDSCDRSGSLRLEHGEPCEDAPVVRAERYLGLLARRQQQVRRAIAQGRDPGSIRLMYRSHGRRGAGLVLGLKRSVVARYVGHWISNPVDRLGSRPALVRNRRRAGCG